ncbi:MAG: hypothetical protein OXE95_14520 [Chloroflexi bacterium]|nr:hypothetical protein [Chloroflexota bacterium]MCY4248783.1 hypothetical protein [Chloroflexota bacterium]
MISMLTTVAIHPTPRTGKQRRPGHRGVINAPISKVKPSNIGMVNVSTKPAAKKQSAPPATIVNHGALLRLGLSATYISSRKYRQRGMNTPLYLMLAAYQYTDAGV